MKPRGQRGKVLVAMSGGVDSSVAAALLVGAGYEVVGCFMRLGSPDEEPDRLALADGACDAGPSRPARGCCSVGDAQDARLVAAELGIPLYVVNFRREFGRIMDYFVAEHAAGRTPNPCIRCNDWLKFGRLHDYAQQVGASYIASGHHARIVEDERGAELWRGVDEAKDQSYVLFGAPRDRLREMLLPVGEMTKPEVRARAEELGLQTFDKPDSQEICFVPDGDHVAFVERRAPGLAKAGALVDTAGRRVGEHGGQHRFTIGQRRGVGVALGRPLYVVEKDTSTNTVIVGGPGDLLVSSLAVAEANWLVEGLAGLPSAGGLRALVQHRAHGRPVGATVSVDSAPDRFSVEYDEPVTGVAPGQAVVCYDADEPRRALGGGWIASTGGARTTAD